MITDRDRLALMHVTGLIHPMAPPTIAAYEYADEQLGQPPEPALTLSIQGLFGGAGIQADGEAQATIQVTVLDENGVGIEGIAVDLTTTLGTLGIATLTTGAGGTATTTLTAGTTIGTATITATLDTGETAETTVPII